MKIEIKNIGKKYEGNKEYTLIDLNAQINSGDFAVLLGPSGSGKTTLLRMIAGLNSITKGDLLFEDKRVNELPPKDRDIAMVFQSYALYPHMNVFDNMAFGLKMARQKKTVIERRVKDAAKILDIDKYLYSKPADLSGGQRQRVALGRAIVRKPKIFLMDEPLSNLDAKLREKMRVELVRIHKMLGTTTVYVTHDQLEAMTMATKILLINEQEIVQIGTPDEIYMKPNSLFAAKFIGTPSMNMFEGKIVNGEFVSNSGTIKVKPMKKHLDLIKKHDIEDVVFGIRSKDVQINDKTRTDLNIKYELDVIENLGGQLLLTFIVSENEDMAVSVDNNSKNKFKPNQKITLNASADTFHFFDKKTGQRITKNYSELKAKWEKHQAFLKMQSDNDVSKKQKAKNKKQELRKNRIS